MSKKKSSIDLEQKRNNALKKELRGMKQRFKNVLPGRFQETSLLFLRDLLKAYYSEDESLKQLALKSYIEVSEVLEGLELPRIDDSIKHYQVVLDAFMATFYEKVRRNCS